jgi:hypothetical protein
MQTQIAGSRLISIFGAQADFLATPTLNFGADRKAKSAVDGNEALFFNARSLPK